MEPGLSTPLPLRLDAVSRRYGQLRVLDGVTLDVAPGEMRAVLGPSGCGKSTLLRVVAGFDRPDTGEVVVDGRPVRGPSPQRGMVTQAGGLFPWLSLLDNVAWGPREAGRRDAADVARRLLAETGLAEFADALPRELSGGMRSRASIAQVLALAPPLLLLDEPFAALDAQTRLQMHEWLRGLLQTHPATVLLVTHDVDEALLLADRLALLSPRPARVVAELPVELGTDRGRQTLTDERFVAQKRDVLERVLRSAPSPRVTGPEPAPGSEPR